MIFEDDVPYPLAFQGTRCAVEDALLGSLDIQLQDRHLAAVQFRIEGFYLHWNRARVGRGPQAPEAVVVDGRIREDESRSVAVIAQSDGAYLSASFEVLTKNRQQRGIGFERDYLRAGSGRKHGHVTDVGSGIDHQVAGMN
jgi:hypothetical protein